MFDKRIAVLAVAVLAALAARAGDRKPAYALGKREVVISTTFGARIECTLDRYGFGVLHFIGRDGKRRKDTFRKVAALGFGQFPKPKPKGMDWGDDDDDDEPTLVPAWDVVTLAGNGAVIQGTVSGFSNGKWRFRPRSVQIAERYGKLEWPAAEILQIRFDAVAKWVPELKRKPEGVGWDDGSGSLTRAVKPPRKPAAPSILEQVMNEKPGLILPMKRGRIGETKAECQRRYGKPTETEHADGVHLPKGMEACTYVKADFRVVVGFMEDRDGVSRAGVITYVKPGGFLGKNIEEDEAKALLQANAGTGKWAEIEMDSLLHRGWENLPLAIWAEHSSAGKNMIRIMSCEFMDLLRLYQKKKMGGF
jgi:hypothetical protein